MNLKGNLSHNLQIIENQWFDSAKKFAEFLDIHPGTLSTYYRQKAMPPVDLLLKLEIKTGITMATLLTQKITSTDLPSSPISKKNSDQQMIFEPEGDYKKTDSEPELKFLKLLQRLELIEKTQLVRSERIAELEERVIRLEKERKK